MGAVLFRTTKKVPPMYARLRQAVRKQLKPAFAVPDTTRLQINKGTAQSV